METEIALKVSQRMSEILKQLDESVAFVSENCSDVEFHQFRAGIGRVMGSLVLDVMNPLYETNPEVKPESYES